MNAELNHPMNRNCCHCKKRNEIEIINRDRKQTRTEGRKDKRPWQVPGITVSTGFNRYGNAFVHLCVVCDKHGILILAIRFAETVIGIGYLWHGVSQYW